jgi:hypothetical protein
MKVVKEILMGFLVALGIWIVLFVSSRNLFGRFHLANYLDFVYFAANIIGLTWFVLKRKWYAAGSLIVFAICLAGPVLLLIVSAVGCLLGQCPII